MVSGFNSSSAANAVAFDQAVEEVTATARRLIQSLTSAAEPKNP
jgi:hypothetical protein